MLKARSCLERLHDYTPGKSKAEVAQKWGLDSIVKLASNENPLGVPKEAVEAVKQMADSLHLYPIGHSPTLTKKLSAKLNLAPERLFLANGSDEVIWLLTTAFLNPGEWVLSSIETFSEYEFCTHLLDGQFLSLPLKEGYFDLEAFKKEIECNPKVKMVFLCSPNNPTGTLIAKAALKNFIDSIPSDVLVVVDQAYVDFVHEDFDYALTDWLDLYPNLVLLRTFSKMYGLAGIRLGYALANEEIVKNLFKVKQPFNVNLIAQAAGEASLDAEDFVLKTLENNALGMKRLENLFAEFSLTYFESHANFICFRMGPDAEAFCSFCESKGLILRWLRSFKLPEYIRITIGLPEELDLFENLLREWKREH